MDSLVQISPVVSEEKIFEMFTHNDRCHVMAKAHMSLCQLSKFIKLYTLMMTNSLNYLDYEILFHVLVHIYFNHITTNVVSLNPAQVRCTRYNIM